VHGSQSIAFKKVGRHWQLLTIPQAAGAAAARQALSEGAELYSLASRLARTSPRRPCVLIGFTGLSLRATCDVRAREVGLLSALPTAMRARKAQGAATAGARQPDCR
jgi:hypothetical protein